MNPISYEQIMSFVGLIALWAFWYYLWKPQRVDILRQQLFALRSDLFDLAASGAVSFNNPAYTELRIMINGMIRFAHRVSLPTVLLAAKMPRHDPNDPIAAWKKSVQKLPDGTRKRLLAIHGDLSEELAKFVIRGSILLHLYLFARVAYALSTAVLRLLLGKTVLRNFTVAQARRKVDTEFKQSRQVTKMGAESIESRVLYEEHRRIDAKREPAFAH